MTDSYSHVLDHYESRIAPGRESYDMLDWGSRESQEARFQVLAGVLRRNWPGSGTDRGEVPPRLLDVGCGFAELAKFLQAQSIAVRYVGVDLSGKFVQKAKEKVPDLDLTVGEIFRRPPFKTAVFDLVFCSGTLNLRVPNHEELVRAALASMLALSRRLLVVNFLHARTRDQYPHCHYCRPGQVVSLLPAVAVAGVEIVDNYLENDFTLVLRKADPAR